MTTAETTQEIAPPETLVEPDELLSELAHTPEYDALVAELGDPREVAAEIEERDTKLREQRTEFRVWVKLVEVEDDGGQHRAEEAADGTDDQRPS